MREKIEKLKKRHKAINASLVALRSIDSTPFPSVLVEQPRFLTRWLPIDTMKLLRRTRFSLYLLNYALMPRYAKIRILANYADDSFKEAQLL